MTTMASHDISTARATSRYRRDGFCLAPRLLPAELVRRAVASMDAVIAGEYSTGVPPRRSWNPGDDPLALRKIDQAHLSDPVLAELCAHPESGRWAAAITGARRVMLWATQLLYKPPGGVAASNVGFHQDRRYWDYWTEDSEVFTAWIALSDVAADSGPMRMVVGSHRWGFIGGGDFFAKDDGDVGLRAAMPHGESWSERAAILNAGGVSFHHRLTIHGSGPNRSPAPRRALALHLRTERSRPVPGATDYFVSHLDDPLHCPTLFAD